MKLWTQRQFATDAAPLNRYLTLLNISAATYVGAIPRDHVFLRTLPDADTRIETTSHDVADSVVNHDVE
jgi:hypothetical protein